MFSAERRFMLLIVCAMAALAALGLLARDGGGTLEAVTTTPVPSHHAAPSLTRSEAPVPSAVLRSVLATSVVQRFPHVAALASPAQSILADRQIVSYYGNPYSADMGILGSDDPDTIAELLEERAEEYDRLNGPTGVISALHLVYAVAQYHAAEDGLYLQYVDDEEVEDFIRVAEEHDMLLFIDLQIGRSSVESEFEKALPYLRNPSVHLALDPEFAVAAGEVPGDVLGSLRAPDINYAQEALARLVRREALPPKLLMVHQFVDSMVLDGHAIRRYPDVDLIIDMDGFGPADIKRVKYEEYAAEPYATHAAIKLFFQHDPDLMSAQDVLALIPRPDVIIYQ